jgi:hypothetical protein
MEEPLVRMSPARLRVRVTPATLAVAFPASRLMSVRLECTIAQLKKQTALIMWVRSLVFAMPAGLAVVRHAQMSTNARSAPTVAMIMLLVPIRRAHLLALAMLGGRVAG